MTDKVQKIREEIEKRYEYWREKESNSHSIESEIRMSECQHLLLILDSSQEEPVSKDLEKAADEYADGENPTCPCEECLIKTFKAGAKWQKNHLWKSADGDDLPEYDREVVVFTQNFPDDAGMMSVAIAHRPNPNGWDGKSLASGKVEHYTPKTYDKGGWNIPDVKYWLDVKLPKEIEL